MRLLLNVLLVLLVCGFAAAQEKIPGQIIVQLQPEVSIKEFHRTISNSEVRLLSKSWNIWLLSFPPGEEEVMMKVMLKSPQVLLAQYNHKISKRALIPNDSIFPNQWSLDNTGQGGGTADADIDAPEAWDFTTSGITSLGDTIVIAVVDEGFDLQHEDLHFWKNRNDPHNGIDDDLNGYIDDFNGWDIDSHTDSIPNDFHGTHTAGIAAAIGNNGIGIAGVAWNAQLMPVSFFDVTEASVVEAYSYIFDMRNIYNQSGGAEGAFVVAANSSFGIDFATPDEYPIWCAMYDSLGNVGVLSIGSTMNITADVEISGDIPTTCTSDYLITVTNTNRFDSKNSTAAFGYYSVDLGAPGTGIYSTVPGDGYAATTGTSMSAPHVAGAVAALYGLPCPHLHQMIQNNPADYALMMKRYILSGTDILSTLDGLTVSGGRLNLFNSMRIYFNECISCLNITSAVSSVTCNGSANGFISVTATDGAPPYDYEWSTGESVSSISSLDRGKYWVKVTDANNCAKFDFFEITEPFALVLHVVSDSAEHGDDGAVAAFISGGISPYSFLWNDPNSSTVASVDSLLPGVYTVTVTDMNGCQIIGSTEVKGFVGVGEAPQETFDIRVFPNPVQSFCWVEIPEMQIPSRLSVYDISGKLLLEKNITSRKTAFNFSEFPQGNYYLKVLSDKHIAVKKIIRL